MASLDDLLATVCAECPDVWAMTCACNGWCNKTGDTLPDPPERDTPHQHCPRCGLNQDPCRCTMGPQPGQVPVLGEGAAYLWAWLRDEARLTPEQVGTEQQRGSGYDLKRTQDELRSQLSNKGDRERGER